MSKKDTKTVLLETALHLIWTESYGSVSVDDICKKAKAKKGSFYHYFDSKAALAVGALEHLWEQTRPFLDQTFSAQHPPLERLRIYNEMVLKEQEEFLHKLGYVVGCPFTSVGSEQCSCSDGLSKKAREVLCRFTTYIKSAIQDAVTEGIIPPVNPAEAASHLMNYELGAMSYARVSNSLEPLRGVHEVWMRMLGVKEVKEKADTAHAA